jgi:hypothetical protein
MRRAAIVLLTLAAAAAAALVAFVHSGAAGDGTAFRTPDAGAACRLEGASLVCSSLGSDGSLALPAHAKPPRVVSRLPWWDAATPMVTRFRHGSIDCRLRAAAIVCRNGATTVSVDAAGFAVRG